MSVEAALLDVDGTLIDANYHRARLVSRICRNGIILPLWRIHRAVGMGGDQLVPALVGSEVDRKQGDAVREARAELYRDLIHEVAARRGALDETPLGTVLAGAQRGYP